MPYDSERIHKKPPHQSDTTVHTYMLTRCAMQPERLLADLPVHPADADSLSRETAASNCVFLL